MLDNTGTLVYQWLVQVDRNTGHPTGLRKPNDPADPDYVAPEENLSACPLPYVWEPIDPYCEATSYYCAPGYVISPDSSHCMKEGSTVATVPVTPAKTVAVKSTLFTNYYAYVFSLGSYSNTSSGWPSYIGYSDTFWTNISGSDSTGPMNRCGLWVDTNNDGTPDAVLNKWIGFVATLDVPEDETVFIGIGATTNARILMTNSAGTSVNVVTNTSSWTLYQEWNVYEVQLKKGLNIIQLEGLTTMSSPLCFGAEIYRNTMSDFYNLQGVQFNVIWSTASLRGQNIHTGPNGYSCPTGYALDFNNGSPICRQVLVDPIKQHNSGKLAYRNRKRLLRGEEDGTVEVNVQGEGVGTYFPPIQDTTTCPIN
ncbi:hypothetical protein [Chitinophaga sp. Cy-1792]|uniref:hypothetical protein n=1 Tax=Chitinophaga sp. Cy-1792 TaxID=2608339 RepID=UPI0014214CCA|nr:hypothetical protein [Chitinophaga sp. Cy-1792]NIG54751.1 hypothetical protein [Chitinophaga sp. Cy-1792]